MQGRKEAVNFLHSATSALNFSQAQYYARVYHNLPLTDADKFARYFYLHAKDKCPSNQSRLPRAFDAFPKGLVNAGYSLFGVRDYTGYVGVLKEVGCTAIEQAIAEGAEQVLILECGFSSYATTHHLDHPGVHFFSVAHGDSFKLKQEALASLRADEYPNAKTKAAAAGLQRYAAPAENMHYVDADVTQGNWADVLLQQQFDPKKKTVCVIGGSCYLPHQGINDFFLNLQKLLSLNSQIVIGLLVPPGNSVQTKADVKVCHSLGADYSTMVKAADAPMFLYEKGFYPIAQFSQLSSDEALGYTAKQSKTNKRQLNSFVARLRQDGDVVPSLQEVPTMKVDWKNHDVAQIKNGV